MSQYVVAYSLYNTLSDLLSSRSDLAPAAIAIEVPGQGHISYAALDARVRRLSNSLWAVGISAGDRVALAMPSNADMSVSLLATAITATAAPLNPDYREEEFRSYLGVMKVSHLLTATGCCEQAESAAQGLGIPVHRVVSGDAGPELVVSGPVRDVGPARPLDPEAVAIVMMTSGSTSQPKRVPLTHRNLCTSVRDICKSLDLTASDRCLSMWEQFHIGGLSDLLLAPLASGGTIISAGTFDVQRFFALLESHHPTWFQAVPTTLNALVRAAKQQGRTQVVSSLRFIRSVAAALSPSLKAEVEALFGVPVIQTFGMTEAAPLITSTQLPPGLNKPGSVGISAGPEVGIMGPANDLLPIGQRGEVVVRGANVMSGYEDAPDLNSKLFFEGWFRTGDLGYQDSDSHLFLVGRAKELISRGGEKISPYEVDDVLQSHPAVKECATFGVPHSTLGENIAAAVVVTGRVPLSAQELQLFAATRLSPFKVPSKIHFVSELPRTANGKVQRHKLTELFASLPETQVHTPPRTALEEELLGIWQKVLQVEALGVEDLFVDLGGDSIAGVALLAAVQEHVGHPLALSALQKLTTIADMARTLESGDESAPQVDALMSAGLSIDEAQSLLIVLAAGRVPTHPDAPLVKVINAKGRRPPLVWCFNSPELEMLKLQSIMPEEQPLYGLYSGSGRLRYKDRVTQALAKCYAENILRILPEGALFVGGNCRGADVATHVTAELEARKRSVSGLCTVDYFVEKARVIHAQQLILVGRDSDELACRRFGWGKPGWSKAFERRPWVDWVLGSHGQFFVSPNIEALWRHVECFLSGTAPQRSIPALLSRYGWLLLRSIPGVYRFSQIVSRKSRGYDNEEFGVGERDTAPDVKEIKSNEP